MEDRVETGARLGGPLSCWSSQERAAAKDRETTLGSSFRDRKLEPPSPNCGPRGSALSLHVLCTMLSLCPCPLGVLTQVSGHLCRGCDLWD